MDKVEPRYLPKNLYITICLIIVAHERRRVPFPNRGDDVVLHIVLLIVAVQ